MRPYRVTCVFVVRRGAFTQAAVGWLRWWLSLFYSSVSGNRGQRPDGVVGHHDVCQKLLRRWAGRRWEGGRGRPLL